MTTKIQNNNQNPNCTCTPCLCGDNCACWTSK